MVKTREEFMEMVKTRIGEDTSDDAISFIEDVTDTLDDYERRLNGDGTDWKAKYEENDKQWRERYVARFNGSAEDYNEDNRQHLTETESKNLKYEDLFKEG